MCILIEEGLLAPAVPDGAHERVVLLCFYVLFFVIIKNNKQTNVYFVIVIIIIIVIYLFYVYLYCYCHHHHSYHYCCSVEEEGLLAPAAQDGACKLRPVRLLRVWISKGLTQADS